MIWTPEEYSAVVPKKGSSVAHLYIQCKLYVRTMVGWSIASLYMYALHILLIALYSVCEWNWNGIAFHTTH